jgi:hypothetical protein
MSKPLVPIFDAIMRTRCRREISKDEIAGWPWSVYNTDDWQRKDRIRHLQLWIDQSTTGKFYLDSMMVAFEDEADMIMFKLAYKELL